MSKTIGIMATALFGLLASEAAAFCGFYVAKADTQIFNRASQVVLVRDRDRTVITMVNDFKGDPKEFAVVVPVPTFLEEGQIHVGDKAVVDHLDAYTAPRLVEYFDENPCHMRLYEDRVPMAAGTSDAMKMRRKESAKALGVEIEASYTVGEYDILILSAKESDGLEEWLRSNGYQLPDGAGPVLGSYLKQGMRFFVAKVNVEEQSKLGFSQLRPLQVAYESPKFMLPIRLGTVNADGPQELFVYTLTKKGRVETTNYRTVKLPTGSEIPSYVKTDFGSFYRAMFDEQSKRERNEVVFLEYAWDMAWCDPCAADPLSGDELRDLGVFWLDEGAGTNNGSASPPVAKRRLPSPARDVFVTRLHVRYDREHFPADLVFQETGDRTNFQGRYVVRHAWTGDDNCEMAESYRAALPDRFEREAQNLANLTGWDIESIRNRIPQSTTENIAEDSGDPGSDPSWWDRLWKQG